MRVLKKVDKALYSAAFDWFSIGYTISVLVCFWNSTVALTGAGIMSLLIIYRVFRREYLKSL